MLARWLIEQRERPPRVSEHTPGEGLFSSNTYSAPLSVPSAVPGSVPHSVSDNVFADRPVPSAEIRGPA